MKRDKLEIEWYHNADGELVVCDGEGIWHFVSSTDNAKMMVLLFKICKRLGIDRNTQIKEKTTHSKYHTKRDG